MDMTQAARVTDPLHSPQQTIEAIRRLMDQVETLRQQYEIAALRLRLVCAEAKGSHEG